MSPESFNILLRHVEPHISKKNTRFCESVPASTRLAVTLRYFASGQSQQSLSLSFRLGRTTVSKIVRGLVKRFGKSYPQFTYARHRLNKNGSKSVVILKKYGIYPIALGKLTGSTLQLNVPKNLDQNISTTKAFLALSFWQSVMPNTASHL